MSNFSMLPRIMPFAKAIGSHALSKELVLSFLVFNLVTIVTEYVEILIFTHKTYFLEE